MELSGYFSKHHDPLAVGLKKHEEPKSPGFLTSVRTSSNLGSLKLILNFVSFTVEM